MRVGLISGMVLSLLLLAGIGWGPSVATGAGLDVRDCIKCHVLEVTKVDTLGQKHKTAVTCLDCHLEHPPAGDEAIPNCSMCHAAAVKPHYALQGCMACHNPHAPLDIDFAQAELVKPVCSSCHAGEGAQLADYPSLHSELDCTACHTEHGVWQSCLECHEGHSAGMTYETCLRCHQPHKPTVVKYDMVSNDWCSGCHAEIVGVLGENRTKHHDLLCSYCHKYQHKLIPECETCHGLPHNRKMHKKYPDCRECHYDPHALDKEG